MSRIKTADLPAEMSAMMQNNLHRAIYNNPAMADLFCGLARGVHLTSNVPHRVRELAILRLASSLEAEVEWAQHFKIAQMVGVTVDEARAVRDDDLLPFSPAERSAIRLAEAVDQCRVDDALWRDAAQHFSDVELLDLVMIAGFYGYASRLTLAMAVEIEPGLTTIAES